MTFQVGATIAGKYKILRRLGEGGMGAVFLAENLDIGRQVAIKMLHAKLGRDPSVVARFRQEARAAAAIQHPGIVDVLDMGQTADGEAYIVMERLEGETLAARIRQRGRLGVDETVSIMVEVLDALAAAHAKDIIHRDLKPENLFLVWRPRWAVKILDFGISRLAGSEDVRLTSTNTSMGSVLYMPPEQARDARTAGVPADLYAVGAVLYHALAGIPPFLGSNYSEVLSAVLTDPPRPLAQVVPSTPPALGELVARLLAKKPADRPASAHAVRGALLDLVGGTTTPPRPAVHDTALESTMVAGSGLAETASTGAPVETAPTAAPLGTAPTAPPIGTDPTTAPAEPRRAVELPTAVAPRRGAPLRAIALVVSALVLAGGGIYAILRNTVLHPAARSTTQADSAAPPIVPVVRDAPTPDQPLDAPIDAPGDTNFRTVLPPDAGHRAPPGHPRVDAGVRDAPPPDAGAHRMLQLDRDI